MSKEIGESDMFLYNAGFHSKFYKVKIGMVSAQKETEPEKQETRQKVSQPFTDPHLLLASWSESFASLPESLEVAPHVVSYW